MALITMPETLVPAEIQWSLRQPTQVNRSEWTGRRKVTILSGAPRWSAKVSLPLILGEAAVRPWRAFLALCQGQAHWFRLIAVENVQITGVSPKVFASQQTGYTTESNGWGGAGVKLRAGQFVTINDQLLQLTADVVSDGNGAALLTFTAYIRAFPAGGTAIIVDRPYARMAMAADEAGWTVGRGQQYSIGFDCEEAF